MFKKTLISKIRKNIECWTRWISLAVAGLESIIISVSERYNDPNLEVHHTYLTANIELPTIHLQSSADSTPSREIFTGGNKYYLGFIETLVEDWGCSLQYVVGLALSDHWPDNFSSVHSHCRTAPSCLERNNRQTSEKMFGISN